MEFQTYPSRNQDLRSRLEEKPRLSQVRKPAAQTLEAIEILEPEEFLQGLILLWLLISSVPISVLALQLALPILSQRFSLLSTSTVEYKTDVVLGPIQALIAIDRGNDLIHLSSNDVIQELTKVWLNKWVQLSLELSFQNVRGQLTICCVQYQLNCGLSAANLKTESDVGRLLGQAPFLAHAATAWNRYYKDFQTLTPPSSLTSKGRYYSPTTLCQVPPSESHLPSTTLPLFALSDTAISTSHSRCCSSTLITSHHKHTNVYLILRRV